jgi:hypothetical protein
VLRINGIFGGEQKARDNDAEQERIAEPAVIANEMTGTSEAIVVREHEQRAGFGNGLDLLRRARVNTRRIY